MALMAILAIRFGPPGLFLSFCAVLRPLQMLHLKRCGFDAAFVVLRPFVRTIKSAAGLNTYATCISLGVDV
jgi:hypothetical protein